MTYYIRRIAAITCRGLLPSFFTWVKAMTLQSKKWGHVIATQSKEMAIHPRGFDEFKEKHIKYSEKRYTFDDLIACPPCVDCLVAGSDQIWILPSPIYMLNFGIKGTIRVSYAASMGRDLERFSNKFLRYEFKRLLKKFDHVTLREQDGVDLCREFGRKDAELVPDPVLLLDGNHYRKIAVAPDISEDYVLIYLLGTRSVLGIDAIISWCESHGLKYKYVAAQGQIDDYPKVYPNVDEWLGLIDGAKYVITNSFHGMVVSILHNKLFMVNPTASQHSKLDSRFSTTLGYLHLENRIFCESLDAIMEPINYESVNQILKNKREEIKAKFNDWLKPNIQRV